ncbi:uncharacterized protein LOC119631903 isoform X1 [Glossina fuscipes]|uniref:Uncharacterized protein LOC119631903 isoform X1 n=1 Tax=Glossina fuscipes TaxID=7396 RepID=A0A8U0W5L2_9MUSC|nr:uncharacterized protein LOC119631903 isoform X1 [Glossina fuscipes]
MEAILPFNTIDRERFLKSAQAIGFDKMAAFKLTYIMQESDLDIFPLMGEERINILLYVWELCNDYEQREDGRKWEHLRIVMRMVVPYSLNIWFSEEWKCCRQSFRMALLYCLERAKGLLKKCFKSIKWEEWLQLGLTPYNVNYLKDLNIYMNKVRDGSKMNSLETTEDPANIKDINYFEQEQLLLILLRLIKLFDSKSMDVVKTLSMRVIAAWNAKFGDNRVIVNREDKRSLIFMCHVYLMAVYETDGVRGYVIDNMINNIRFYYQGFKMQVSKSPHAMESVEYTPARFIALTCVNLSVEKREFFESFICHSYDTHLVTLFGVTSQAYKSYLLGNMLMELNLMNEENFASNFQLYKFYMNMYVVERENSERFLLEELRKKEAQHYAHNVMQTIRYMTDFKSKICKGNRMSNIGSYENADDREESIADDRYENGCNADNGKSDRKLDTVFQNIPNSENVLYYVYELLALRSYKGWHFAKIIILLKIIGHELNAIETWRYHPGLTTNFMLNLEIKLSRHYEDLAKVFEEHPFLEQEFWLTAFYLNPTNRLHDHVIRCGMRFNKRRFEEHQKSPVSLGAEKIPVLNAKYGLLSSTIDVKEIADVTNNEALACDYKPLFQSLHSLRLPESVVKDILTVIFLPRNKNFAWAVNWVELRKRCKLILKNSLEKRRFIELNMAEANDRLKFLHVDYEKYKNRPQLDYGTIEEGYENHIYSGEYIDNESDAVDDEEEEEEEGEDFEDDEDNYTTPGRELQKQKNMIEENILQNDAEFQAFGKRRTRARTAAAVANAILSNVKKSCYSTPGQKSPEPNVSTSLAGRDQEKSAGTAVLKRDLHDWLKVRPKYINSTQGFKALADVWNVKNCELKAIDKGSSLLKSLEVSQRFQQLKTLQGVIKMGQKEEEHKNDKHASPLHDCATGTVENTSECIEGELTVQEGTAGVIMENIKCENIITEQEIVQMPDILQNNIAIVTNKNYENSKCPSDKNIELCDFGNAYSAVIEQKQQIVPHSEARECGDQSAINMNTEHSTVIQNAIPLTPKSEYTSKHFAEIPTKACHKNCELITKSTFEQSQPAEQLEDLCERSLDKVKDFKSLAELISDDNGSASQQVIGANMTDKSRTYDSEILEEIATVCDEPVSYHNRKDAQDLLKTRRFLEFQNACFKKQLKVRLRKLNVNDLSNLRQPRVLLKRVSVDSRAEILNNSKKRRRIQKIICFDSDESSGSNSLGTNSKVYHKRRRLPSDSSDYSLSDEYKPYRRKAQKRFNRDRFSNAAATDTLSPSHNACRHANLVVTPRSASGLKLRISNVEQATHSRTEPTVIDIIQLSSSSSDVDVDGHRPASPISEFICPDPLYEEEIII